MIIIIDKDYLNGKIKRKYKINFYEGGFL